LRVGVFDARHEASGVGKPDEHLLMPSLALGRAQPGIGRGDRAQRSQR
jgi:hypothetical protein